MTISRTRLAVIVIAAMIAGWWLNDAITPSKNRPILDFIKRFWWVPLVIDDGDQAYHTRDHAESQRAVGHDGFPLVDHRRAF